MLQRLHRHLYKRCSPLTQHKVCNSYPKPLIPCSHTDLRVEVLVGTPTTSILIVRCSMLATSSYHSRSQGLLTKCILLLIFVFQLPKSSFFHYFSIRWQELNMIYVSSQKMICFLYALLFNELLTQSCFCWFVYEVSFIILGNFMYSM
jgi:hypothetical protein